jgi:hypothetical protein
VVAVFLKSTEAKQYNQALEDTTDLIEGFESPLGLELLGTVDWLSNHDNVEATPEGIKKGLQSWLGGGEASQRKLQLFEDGLISLALSRLAKYPPKESANAPASSR